MNGLSGEDRARLERLIASYRLSSHLSPDAITKEQCAALESALALIDQQEQAKRIERAEALADSVSPDSPSSVSWATDILRQMAQQVEGQYIGTSGQKLSDELREAASLIDQQEKALEAAEARFQRLADEARIPSDNPEQLAYGRGRWNAYLDAAETTRALRSARATTKEDG